MSGATVHRRGAVRRLGRGAWFLIAGCSAASAAACGEGRPAVGADTVSRVAAGATNRMAAVVNTRDVHNFVAAMRQMTPGDSECRWLAPYFRNGSDGLSAYDLHFGVHQAQLCAAVRAMPARYARIDSTLASTDSAAAMTDSLFKAFGRLYTGARSVPVYFVVGTGISGGTTVGLLHPVVLVAAERQWSTAGTASTLVHEFIHAQQNSPVLGALTGGPPFLRGSVLRHSIKEGSADFLTDLLTGQVRHNAYAESHEGELWAAFRRDMHGSDYSRWLYNGQHPARGDLPPDLGYWMGYRITKAFYDKASDKRGAIRDILNIRNFDDFLKRSGYDGPPRTPP